MDIWSKINDKLPPYGVHILGRKDCNGFYLFDSFYFYKDVDDEDSIYKIFDNYDYTEWMEIPE